MRDVRPKDFGARIRAGVRAFLADRSGATALEYGLIATGISVAIIVTVFVIGSQIDGLMSKIATELGVNL